uniref:Seminal fluid protein HACP037 n=1 Tax=Rhipicephalus zambeziensis TaxID=60191 RepID=A0A224YQS7_9ACAR
MIYFIVGVSLLLGSASSVRAQGLQINEYNCDMPTQGMIVNGSVAQAGQFPWMVYLEIRSIILGFACGGTIITKRHILTAAHCTHSPYIPRIPVRRIDAYYGNTNWRLGKSVMVTKMIRHPNYRPGMGLKNDIAILVVDRPFQFGDNVRPACLSTTPFNILNTQTEVAGWGRLIEGGNAAQHLQYTEVTVVPHEMCSNFYRELYNKDIMYCTYQKGTSSCHGDSGGAAISRLVGGPALQVGIVSFGGGCARDKTPIVFTRVDAFAPWIKQVVSTSLKAYPSEGPLQLPSYNVPQWPFIFPFP